MVFNFNPAWLPGGFVGVDVIFTLKDFIKENKNKKILILSQVPKLDKSPERILRVKYIGGDGVIKKDPAYISANLILEDLARQ